MKKKPKNQWRVVISDAVMFDWLLLIGFLVMVVVAFNYNARARSIPMALGIIGAVMISFQLVVDMFPSLTRIFRFVGESGLLAGQERLSKSEIEKKAAMESDVGRDSRGDESTHNERREWVKIFRLILWLAAFIVLLGMTHYLLAVGLFVILVTRLEANESWLRSGVLAVCVNAGFFILFDLILKAQL